jgi:DNA replication protein DnaC
VDQACRALRLPTIRTRVEESMAAATREQLSYWRFLAELLLAECNDRDRRRSVRRVKAAGFPREKWLADFDFEANSDINPAIIHTLAPVIGSAKVNRCVLSVTPAPGKRTYSSR